MFSIRISTLFKIGAVRFCNYFLNASILTFMIFRFRGSVEFYLINEPALYFPVWSEGHKCDHEWLELYKLYNLT